MSSGSAVHLNQEPIGLNPARIIIFSTICQKHVLCGKGLKSLLVLPFYAMRSDSVQGNLSGPMGPWKAQRVQTCDL